MYEHVKTQFVGVAISEVCEGKEEKIGHFKILSSRVISFDLGEELLTT